MQLSRTLGLLLFFSLPAVPCTCVFEVNSNARTEMDQASLVFRGTAIERSTLPQRAEMKGRGRYAVTFRVVEYWKGSPAATVVLYDMDPDADCQGWGYEAGKNYLVYASQTAATDVSPQGDFWYGWTDVLPEGSKMLIPTPCTEGGETKRVRKALRQLGKGRVPAK
jgi:hypothetical protein